MLKHTLLFVLLAVLSTIYVCHAELPPYVYEEWKAAASEVLLLQVDTVTSDPSANSQDPCESYFLVNATVVQVNRSSAALEQGDVVSFQTYLRQSEPESCLEWVGPRPPIELAPDDCIVAFLNHTASTTTSRFFQLGAGGASFEPAEGCSFVGATPPTNPNDVNVDNSTLTQPTPNDNIVNNTLSPTNPDDDVVNSTLTPPNSTDSSSVSVSTRRIILAAVAMCVSLAW